MLAASGMDVYKQTIRRCAPKYDAITSWKEKTSYTSDIVTELVSKGILFIEKAGNQFILYDMDTTEAFKKIREKVRQAMMDFLRKKTAVSIPETSILEVQHKGPDLPEISILEFQNEGPISLGRDLMNVFDAPLDPEITQVLDKMKGYSEEGGGVYGLEEGQDEEMDDLSFSDFTMMD